MTSARRNPYELNYARLEALIDQPFEDLETDTAYRYRAPSFRP